MIQIWQTISLILNPRDSNPRRYNCPTSNPEVLQMGQVYANRANNTWGGQVKAGQIGYSAKNY